MNNSRPAEIQVMELPEGAWYRLPRRPARVRRWFAMGAIIYAAAAAAFAIPRLFVMANFAQGAANPAAQAFIQFLIPNGPLWICLIGCALFLCAWAGHSEVMVRDGELLAIERMGPLHWTWRRALERIEGFLVHAPSLGPIGRLLVIRAACKGVRALWLAPGYPRDWLRPLADDLCRRCTALQTQSDLSHEAPAIEVDEAIEDQAQAEFPDRPNQPAGSKAAAEQRDDGLALSVPPAKLGLAGGAILTGIVQILIIVVVLTVLLMGAAVQGGLPSGMYFVLVWFWLLPLIVLLVFIHQSRRRHTFVIASDTLSIMQKSPVLKKRWQWSAAEIECIQVGRNRRLQLELQIDIKKQKRFAFLEQRDQRELEWLATVLRRALRVPALKFSAQPASTTIVVKQHPDGVTVFVPQLGLWHDKVIWLFFLSLAWFAIFAAFTIVGVLQGDPNDLVLLPLWIFGIAPLLAVINKSERRVFLAVVGPALMILQTGIFGSKRREWPRQEIARIRVGPSGATFNDEHLLELQLYPKKHRKVGFLRDRDDRELQWLAALLRQALNL
jgi:hypothetical protein